MKYFICFAVFLIALAWAQDTPTPAPALDCTGLNMTACCNTSGCGFAECNTTNSTDTMCMKIGTIQKDPKCTDKCVAVPPSPTAPSVNVNSTTGPSTSTPAPTATPTAAPTATPTATPTANNNDTSVTPTPAPTAVSSSTTTQPSPTEPAKNPDRGSGGGFSTASFFGGAILVAAVVLVAFVIYKVRKAKKVQNPYSQF